MGKGCQLHLSSGGNVQSSLLYSESDHYLNHYTTNLLQVHYENVYI